MSRLPQFVKPALPPLGFAALVCLVWQALVVLLDIKPFLLPSPIAVLKAFTSDLGDFAASAGYTALAAVCGLVASSLVGLVVGILFSQSALIRRSGYPYAIYLQTAPIVAVAPLLVNWIGEGFGTIVVVVFIISLFPIVTNTTDGLLATPPELRELFQLNSASRWQALWMLQLPYAMPQIITGVKISSAMVILGATVGEYFVGSLQQGGLGNVIFKANSLLRTDRLFAATILCTVLSVAIFSAVSFFGSRAVRWSDS